MAEQYMRWLEEPKRAGGSALALVCVTMVACSDMPAGTASAAPSESAAPSSAVSASTAGRLAAEGGKSGAGPSAVAATAGAPAGPTPATGGASPAAISGRGGTPAQSGGPSLGGEGGGGITARAGAGGPGEAGAAGSAGAESTPTSTCMRGVVKAPEVVFIGESFIALSGAIPRFTTQLAREAGVIGMADSYRSFAVSGTQLTTGEIAMQYENAKAEGPVKVVLMDGGGNDLLLGNRCQRGFDAGCMEIIGAVDTLFKQMKEDGVKDVVYFFYPDPMGIGAQIKDAMDMLRPEMQKFCEGTTDVRCIWVDQRETWEGNYDRYTSDGIHPTDAGSMASAQQIWDAMVASCIAQ